LVRPSQGQGSIPAIGCRLQGSYGNFWVGFSLQTGSGLSAAVTSNPHFEKNVGAAHARGDLCWGQGGGDVLLVGSGYGLRGGPLSWAGPAEGHEPCLPVGRRRSIVVLALHGTKKRGLGLFVKHAGAPVVGEFEGRLTPDGKGGSLSTIKEPNPATPSGGFVKPKEKNRSTDRISRF